MSADRVVMITGAAGHLGRAVAAHFEAAGARLVLVDHHRDRLATGRLENDRCLLTAADLANPVQVQHAVDRAIERFGRIDVLCNLTGGFRMGEAVHETSDATWDFLLDLNVRTLLRVVRVVVPHMLKAGSGHVVNVGAAAALKGGAQMGAYAAAKSAVIRLTESMAAELRDRNIHVNCVLPTILDTPDNRAAMPDADFSRWVPLAAAADVIGFLGSDASRAVNGAAVPVNGLS
jgi:NAD(P)-dependent dehydrogenase (short-subunit alcohol dehydrogenase family)